MRGVSSFAALGLGLGAVISNVVPRRDTSGQIMDAHDGNFFEKDGLYYWYAASYGLCKEPSGPSGCADIAPGACGFQFNHNVSLWTSADLATWTPQGAVFQNARDSHTNDTILFCPKVLYNAKTSKYVLWWNYVLSTSWSDSYYAVATADAPTGPFTVANPKVTTLAYDDTGDFNLFQDDDGTAYIIYTSHISGYPTTHQMSVEQLTDDYTATLGASASSGFFGSSNVEAPALFSRNGIYYAVFGSCCCYCGSGSAVTVHTATSPLGPYSTQNTISSTLACPKGAASKQASLLAALGVDAEPLSLLDAAAGLRGRQLQATIPAQQTHIGAFKTAAGTQYMWIGDRWQSAPDGIKGHDFTFWSPLTFQPDGNITAMAWTDNFTINALP